MPRRRKTTSEGTQPSPLGQWLRSIRGEQGMSQRSLADRAGISRSYLCDIERGRGAQPSIETIDRLAVALGYSRDDLLRAGGMIEGGPGDRPTDDERRLLAVFRGLDDDGKSLVMRFARFVHADEHSWIQAGLGVGDDAQPASSTAHQSGPSLFDLE
ncbi:MAG TPA: helix-turn-helix transcriptional regulator [Thermomicrobiales bacterium]|nr:helix-turn-helix transcriptional regulator [Thermomicrobiales bacterium]